jgi:outer membrane protein assembly factor BamB
MTAGIQAAVVFDEAGCALVADMGGLVRCFNSAGRRLWEFQADGPVSATPAADAAGRRLFVGTHTGSVHCLRTEDGTELWRSRLPTSSDPRIVADLLFLNGCERVVASSWGGRFHALDAASGSTRHTWDAGISPQSPASADCDDNIYCLRAVRGEGISLIRMAPDGTESVLYRKAEGERPANRSVVSAAPVIDPERKLLCFIANGDRSGNVHAWDLAANRLAWSVELERAVVATPAFSPAGRLLVADMTGTLTALEDGAIGYRYSTDSDYLLAGPVCDGTPAAYLGDPLGAVHRIDAEGKGRRFFEAQRSIQARPSWNPHGELFVPAMDGRVYVFDRTV